MNERKSLPITKGMVWAAWLAVRKGGEGAGVDGIGISEFEANLSDNLYRLWNRMTSGSYFPSPVRPVPIPKGNGKVRVLGIPTVADRVAQMVAKQYLEPRVDPLFHDSSFGFRPGRRAHDALAACRNNCRRLPWVIDLDIQNFFDEIDHELLMKALKRHVGENWLLLYVRRWLEAGVLDPNGQLSSRQSGTPQGGVISPLLANLFLHYVFDKWMEKYHGEISFERYADDIIVHCRNKMEAKHLHQQIIQRMASCGLKIHPVKTQIVYCKTESRKQAHPKVCFDFLGFTFKPRYSKKRDGRMFLGFNPGVSRKALKKMNARIIALKVHRWSHKTLEEIAEFLNPILRGWLNYFSWSRPSELSLFYYLLNSRLAKWVRNKYKRLHKSKRRSWEWLKEKARENPRLFAHWENTLGRPAD